MLLAIDNGNTNISFGLFQNDQLLRTWTVATDRRKTADEYGITLLHLFQRDRIPVEEVKAVALATVVPPLRDVLASVSRQLFGLEPWVLEPGRIQCGITLKVDYPAEVGADRIAASAGARQRFSGPLIVIDFGTATTFDCVTAQGEYLGGAIAPGIEISAEALFQRTAMLPRVQLTAPPRTIGRNTSESLRSGLIYGYVGMVEGIIQRMRQELGTPEATVVATGGMSPVIARETRAIQHVIPTLVLEGLHGLWKAHGSGPTSAGSREAVDGRSS